MAEGTHYRVLPGWLSPRERVALAVIGKRDGWRGDGNGRGYQTLELADDVTAGRLVRRALDALGGPVLFDAALIRYPVGCEVPAHVDLLDAGPGGPDAGNRCRLRLTALVIGSAGALLYLGGEEVPLDDGDAWLMRPDLLKHQLTAVERNARLVFSVGAVVDAAQARRLGLA